LTFADAMSGQFRQHATHQVTITGEAEFGLDGQPRRIAVDSLSSSLSDEDFWGPVSIHALAAGQGVTPFSAGADELLGSADDLIEAIFGDAR